MIDNERQEARPADPRLLPGDCHKCGCPRVDNPHPDAGKPGRYLEVGCTQECLPCTVLSRHQWHQRAMKAEQELRELKEELEVKSYTTPTVNAEPSKDLLEIRREDSIRQISEAIDRNWKS